jgi:hypothetical protein
MNGEEMNGVEIDEWVEMVMYEGKSGKLCSGRVKGEVMGRGLKQYDWVVGHFPDNTSPGDSFFPHSFGKKEGRRKKEEGRRKKEEGRRKKEEGKKERKKGI